MNYHLRVFLLFLLIASSLTLLVSLSLENVRTEHSVELRETRKLCNEMLDFVIDPGSGVYPGQLFETWVSSLEPGSFNQIQLLSCMVDLGTFGQLMLFGDPENWVEEENTVPDMGWEEEEFRI